MGRTRRSPRLRDAGGRSAARCRLRAAAAWYAADLALRRGRVAEAEDQARTALGLVDDDVNVLTRRRRKRARPRAGRARRVRRGARAAARAGPRRLDDGDAVGERVESRPRAPVAGRGRLRARPTPRRPSAGRCASEQGRPNPTWTPWRSTAALALAHLGRRDGGGGAGRRRARAGRALRRPGADRRRAARARGRRARRRRARGAVRARAGGRRGRAGAARVGPRCGSSSAARSRTSAGASRRATRCVRHWPTPTRSARRCSPSAPGASSWPPGCARARRRSRAPPR